MKKKYGLRQNKVPKETIIEPKFRTYPKHTSLSIVFATYLVLKSAIMEDFHGRIEKE